MKLFAAIRPTPKIITILTRQQRGVSGAKWSGPEKLHITLGYFGEVDAEKADALDLELAGQKMTGFDVSLSGAGHFGSSEPHAIWVGVDPSNQLTALYKHVRRSARHAKIEMETQPFMPHVTLAYLKRDPVIDRIVAFEKRLAGFKAGPFIVDEFCLYSSHSRKGKPNQYKVEATYPLIGNSS